MGDAFVELDRDTPFIDQIETCVDRIERTTRVDVVVSITPHSGSYADVYLRGGIATALVALLAILFGPWTVRPVAVPVDLALALLAGWLATRRSWTLTRLLSSPGRRRHQVEQAAFAAVHETHMTMTPERTGLLVHLSPLEREAVVIPDIRLQHGAAADTWKQLEDRLDEAMRTRHPQKAILAGLDGVGEILAQAFPATEDSPHYIPNRPRMVTP
jgi:putative membrane protein